MSNTLRILNNTLGQTIIKEFTQPSFRPVISENRTSISLNHDEQSTLSYFVIHYALDLWLLEASWRENEE